MRRTLTLFLSLAVLAGLIQPDAAMAVAANDPPPSSSPARPMPENPYKNWDGEAGVPSLVGNPVVRQVIADNAELAEDFEVRDAAKAALDAGTEQALHTFLDTGLDAANARAAARKAETARQNRAVIQALVGTGGPIFKAEVQRVLAGTDTDREQFLAYGKEIAQARDEQSAVGDRERAGQLRARVTALVGVAGPNVKRAAEEALNTGDAAIAEFLRAGYLVAAKKDADEREAYLREQEAREKAAEGLSDLAKRAARAMTARRNLVSLHGNGLRALERVANAMVLAANEARKAEQILAANTAGGQHPPDSFTVVKAEVARQLTNARNAAGDAQQAAEAAGVEASVLVDTGLTYGTQWADMARGMSAAARAAVLASETAQHAITATQATDQARDAQEKAQRHAEQAHQWRLHAEEHARAAASVAEAARVQAVAAQDAAARAKQARIEAEAAEREAWAAAARTKAARQTAETERDKAAAARQVAERERVNAAAARQRADKAAADARSFRGEAQRQAGIAEAANTRAQGQEQLAVNADGRAQTEERGAAEARDRAFAAEQAKQTAQARAEALEAAAAAARGTSAADDARRAADQARRDADTASAAAVTARTAANNATGAAVVARQAATEATRAAARARAAAQEARAAARAADAAAGQAETGAAETHAAAQRTNVKAAEATENETRAAEAARAAVQLAEQAAHEAVQSLRAAERTRAESEAASKEAVSAATQANLALQASMAARSSSAAITDPANTAISVVAPFTGSDIDADFVVLVADQARAVGAEQAAAARQRADEAVLAARQAADAAAAAGPEVKLAFDAAAAAANSASQAAQSAAHAQQAAADAAVEGALARAAGERANQADAQARSDAVAARNAANQANADAAIAGRSADAAAREAQAARDSARAAERDAAAAREAATKAETAAAEARSAADNAEQHARSAAEAAARARESATEAQQAADRAEEQARLAEEERRAAEAAKNGTPESELSPDELELLFYEAGYEMVDEYREGIKNTNKTVPQFLAEIGAEVLLEVLGVNDAIKCFGEGNVEACFWTVLNIASFFAIIGKLPAVTKAVARVVAGIVRYLEASAAGRKVLQIVRGAVGTAKANKCLIGIVADVAEGVGSMGARSPDVQAAGKPDPSCINWSKVSKVTFGHAFERHGAGNRKLQKLIGRAAGTKQQQGQWLDDDRAVEILKTAFDPEVDVKIIDIPEGLGHVILPDGSIRPTTKAIIKRAGNGLIKTAYPHIPGIT